MKSVLVILIVGFILLLLLLVNKKQVRKVMEHLSVYWFRLAFSFLLLFVLNIAAGFFGIYVPINIASGLLIAVLGIPGFASICFLAFLL
ncbi:pro-sigmaK processing inhibitor BofA family protein [Sporosarcina sp. G11-34]|uniref:pro-sigmaK processing inhibitor BofA family protein n=1 Tax=Sporosarcina sp. G11-34 TaxID=2849605 RepID=UPI0022A91AC8|nr:pro-sigmaK processing inhibitor BofA family protein [Sporosarcina sp. G11-34]MCZ2260893.1 pro-sigmaK processing inhibitor BofA family protein [Sporosarcina sp. G11-34]